MLTDQQIREWWDKGQNATVRDVDVRDSHLDLLRENATLRAALTEAEGALKKLCVAALTIAPCLYTPYPDAPTLTPWSRWLDPAVKRGDKARRAARAALGEKNDGT